MKKIKNLKKKLIGPVFSVITPFKENEDIDFKSLKTYLEKIYFDGGRIFYVMAYNSRFSQLTNNEIKNISKFVIKIVKKLDKANIVILADPIHCSTKVSLEFCDFAYRMGADIISLIFREKIFSNEQVYKHFKYCSDNSNIPILIHEMPFLSGKGGHQIDWEISLLTKISKLKNVIAIKEDAKNDHLSKKVIKKLKKDVNIIISGGGKRQWLKFANIGCQSWLNGIGVFEPKLAVIFWQAYLKNDRKIIEFIINKFEKPFFDNVVKKFGWHISIKAALEAKNLMGRNERMPMLKLNRKDYNYVKKIINNMPFKALESLSSK